MTMNLLRAFNKGLFIFVPSWSYPAKRKRKKNITHHIPTNPLERSPTTTIGRTTTMNQQGEHASSESHVESLSSESSTLQASTKPSRVRRPLNAYNLFFRDHRARFLAYQRQHADSPSLTKMVTLAWKRAPPDVKRHYMQLATQDKRRQEEAMTSPWVTKRIQQRDTEANRSG